MARRIFATIVALACLTSTAICGKFAEVTDFGLNPTGVQMFVYTPTTHIANPPVIVSPHWCHGTAQQVYEYTQYASLSETYGYIVIYPNTSSTDGCWDVHTNETLTHDAGGDSLAIAEMVRYAIAHYDVDASRVYVTGVSSGAMMTNVLIGAYPDLFKAATAYAGVPFGCFAGPESWNTQCAEGQVIKTAQKWGDQVRASYPGYTGPRPKFRTYHGTDDTTLYYQNFIEEIKQWSNIFDVSFTRNVTHTDSISTTMIYGDGSQFVAVSDQGVGHSITVRETEDLIWFGISDDISNTTYAH